MPRAPGHRQRSGADRRREAVLAAARNEFADAGYHGATTAAIAKRANISQSYIYALFSSKKDLFLACHRWNHQQIMAILESTSEDVDTMQIQASINQHYDVTVL